MAKNDEIPVVIRDSRDLKHVFIEINTKKNAVTVISNYSAWENLALLMEGVGITAKQCISEGISKDKVQKTMNRYLMQLLVVRN